MIKIEIEVPCPRLTVGLFAAAVIGVVWMNIGGAGAMGGLGMRAQVVVKNAEDEARQARLDQAVISHQEEILRYELDMLTRQHAQAGANSSDEQQIWEARQKLVALLQDKQEAEQRLLQSLKEMWAAQGGAALASVGASGSIPMIWPVPPDEGLSATFGDLGYRKRFHMEHQAIDIPVVQESTVVAAADGVVLSAEDKGMGFNALTIRHKGGIVTLYGHVSTYLVKEGDRVYAGDPIALSGGLPGTPGAGWLTTGAHLHFQVLMDGQPVDPLKFLPSVPTVEGD